MENKEVLGMVETQGKKGVSSVAWLLSPEKRLLQAVVVPADAAQGSGIPVAPAGGRDKRPGAFSGGPLSAKRRRPARIGI